MAFPGIGSDGGLDIVKYVITGAHGFLGWHLSCRIRSFTGVEPVRVGRNDMSVPGVLAAAIREADVVFHLAGVNRADSDDAVREGNPRIAETLAAALRAADKPARVIYANSVQAHNDSPYGAGKRRAARILRAATERVGGSFCDVFLPNLFGEHGRSGYNSYVATFCHRVASGGVPQVTDDREIPLLHAQGAARALLEAACSGSDVESPEGEPRAISKVRDQILGFAELYARGEIPDVSEPFNRDLFNTYRSFCFPHHFPLRPALHTDARGRLFESVRSHGGAGQAFVSTTVPGAVRGEHYHLHKIERFLVISGEAEIALRRLYDDQVVRYFVTGAEPAFVDMPTMWAHNIKNTGASDLVTAFWADQLLDPESPDQYPAKVDDTEVNS